MLLNKNKNIPENNKCVICKKYITIEDLNNNNYEVVETKRKTKQYAHTNCIKRRNKNVK